MWQVVNVIFIRKSNQYLVLNGAQSQGHFSQLHRDLRWKYSIQVQVFTLLLLGKLVHILTMCYQLSMHDLWRKSLDIEV